MSVERPELVEEKAPGTDENSKLNRKDIDEYNKLLVIDKELDEELNSLKKELRDGPSMKEIMSDLHEYNDIKDSTQIVFGAMAEIHGTTVSHFHDKYNVPKD